MPQYLEASGKPALILNLYFGKIQYPVIVYPFSTDDDEMGGMFID